MAIRKGKKAFVGQSILFLFLFKPSIFVGITQYFLIIYYQISNKQYFEHLLHQKRFSLCSSWVVSSETQKKKAPYGEVFFKFGASRYEENCSNTYSITCKLLLARHSELSVLDPYTCEFIPCKFSILSLIFQVVWNMGGKVENSSDHIASLCQVSTTISAIKPARFSFI
jgi:hypothetical protein